MGTEGTADMNENGEPFTNHFAFNDLAFGSNTFLYNRIQQGNQGFTRPRYTEPNRSYLHQRRLQ